MANKVCIKKKSIKIFSNHFSEQKFYLIKSCPIEFKLSHFLDKIFGKNMLGFQLNRTTFYKIKFLLRKIIAENFDTFF